MLQNQLLKCVIMCVCAATCIVADAATLPNYALKDLGVPSGYSEVIPGQTNKNGSSTAIAIGPIYNKGILFRLGRTIDLVPTAIQSNAQGINANGSVVGSFYNGVWAAYIYNAENGTVTAFQFPGGASTDAESINDLGQIAGQFQDQAFNSHLFIRDASGNSWHDLGSNFGIDPSALAINNQGRVLIGTYDPLVQTFITIPGSTTLEQVPPLVPGGDVSPGDMNKTSTVVGWGSVNSNDDHAFIYSAGKIKDLGVLPGTDSSYAYSVNNYNQVVGGVITDSQPIIQKKKIVGYTPEIVHGWVTLDGKTLYDLNNLLNKAAKGWTIADARSINDQGVILADANYGTGPTHAVLLTPNVFIP